MCREKKENFRILKNIGLQVTEEELQKKIEQERPESKGKN